MKRIAILLISLCYAMTTLASNYSFSYGEGDYKIWGIGKAETFDVAIHINDLALSGYKIKEISVPIFAKTDGDIVNIWLSSELKIEDKKNVADICSEPVEVADKTATLRLPESYNITDKGVYVGYSFTINKENLDEDGKKPIVVYQGKCPESFFIHSSKSYRNWTDLTKELNGISAISVVLEGETGERSVAISSIDKTYAGENKEWLLPMTVSNQGNEDVRDITLSYEVEGSDAKGEIEYTLPCSLVSKFNAKMDIDLPMPIITEKGDYSVAVAITGVNGKDNSFADVKRKGELSVLSRVPTHRPVMEEYTGTWCGYCVRGFAAIEHLSAKYPTDFIAIAYHNDDPLEIMPTSEFPGDVAGFPYCYIDRTIGADPYLGSENNDFGIENDWLKRCKTVAPADISVTCEWDGSDIISETTVNFVLPISEEYQLAYVLLHDDLHGESPEWFQKNYYSNGAQGTAENFIPEMERFCNGPQIMPLNFNDVIIAHSNLKGIEKSLEGASVNNDFTHRFVFESVCENNLLQDPQKVRAVAMIVNTKTRQIVNAAKSDYATSSVDSISCDICVPTVVTYYNLNGAVIDKPENGIFIKSTQYSDGSLKTEKIIIHQ